MQPILEVGIGLILAVATLSVVVSSTMELISALMRLRAKSLEQGIARMLDDQRRVPRKRGGKLGVREPDRPSPAAAAVLNHPLIKALSSGRSTDRAPSYIDAITFATALLGSSLETPVLIAAMLGSPEHVAAAMAQVPDAVRPDFETAWKAAKGDTGRFVSSILALSDQDRTRAGLAAMIGGREAVEARVAKTKEAGEPVADALRQAYRETLQRGEFNSETFLNILMTPRSITDARKANEDVKVKLADIKRTNPHLGESLEALYFRAGSQFNKFREEIEDWFDREMARVSGWYSRWTQWVMVFVGITLALVLNVSVVTVGKVLWEDPTLRDSIADLATTTTTTTTTTPATTTTVDSSDVTDGAAVSLPTPPATSAPSASEQSSPNTTDVAEAANKPASVRELQEHGLPIGWNKNAWPGTNWYLILHVLGILMAGIAASFGAPFWFDLLNRFVNLRAAGKPPEPATKTR